MSQIVMFHTNPLISRAIHYSSLTLSKRSFSGRSLTDIAGQILRDIKRSDNRKRSPSLSVRTMLEALSYMEFRQIVQITRASDGTFEVSEKAEALD